MSFDLQAPKYTGYLWILSVKRHSAQAQRDTFTKNFLETFHTADLLPKAKFSLTSTHFKITMTCFLVGVGNISIAFGVLSF